MKPITPEERARNYIRYLIWLYFWMLLLEGALRKWAFPELSNPLLVVRDPIVLLIYFLSFRARVFPSNPWVMSLIVMAFLCVLATFVQLMPYVPPLQISAVAGYGVACQFLSFASDFHHGPRPYFRGR